MDQPTDDVRRRATSKHIVVDRDTTAFLHDQEKTIAEIQERLAFLLGEARYDMRRNGDARPTLSQELATLRSQVKKLMADLESGLNNVAPEVARTSRVETRRLVLRTMLERMADPFDF